MPNTEDYAIVIGISDYLGFKPLPAAEGDAVEFAKWLRDPAGGDIPDTQVKVIVTSDQVPVAGKKGVYPWRDHIDDRLSEIIGGRQGRIGRRLYLYFSGHGVMPTYANIALLMANAEKEQLGRNMGATPYRDALANLAHFDELVFILDCCGTFEKEVELGKPGWSTGDVDPNAAKVKTLIALGTEMGQSVFAPDDGLQRSFFTKYLLEGLHGAAAAADGSITAASLRIYVTPKVTSEALPYRQVPDIPDCSEYRVPAGRARPAQSASDHFRGSGRVAPTRRNSGWLL